MSEENTTQTEANQVKQPSTEASKNNVSEGNIPTKRFNEVNTQKYEYKSQVSELQAQVDKFKADAAAKQQKQLEQEGKWKEIAEQKSALYEKTQAALDEKNEYFTNKRKTYLEQITDDSDKSIAESLPFDKLELFVSKVNKLNSLPTNTSRAANQQPVGEMGGYSSYAEWADKDPKGYQENNNSIKSSGIKIGYGD